MVRLRDHAIRWAVVCLWLFALVSLGGALAQPVSSTENMTPATLRLAQVVPRLPVINLYALAQDEHGMPVGLSGGLSALVGSNDVSVEIGQDEGIGIVFLIDISLSLKRVQFELIKHFVQVWIDGLGAADQAAIVTLGSSVSTVQPFTAEKPILTSAVEKLAPQDKRTLLYQGLVQAIDLSRRLDPNLPLRRAIVVLTDGQDDQQGGAGRQEVIDKLAVDSIPIYGIGASGQHTVAADAALKELAGLARESGGEFWRVEASGSDQGYLNFRNIVSATRHLTASCKACPANGSTLVVRLLLSQGNARFSSESMTVRSVGKEGEVVVARSGETAEPTKLPIVPVEDKVPLKKAIAEPPGPSRAAYTRAPGNEGVDPDQGVIKAVIDFLYFVLNGVFGLVNAVLQGVFGIVKAIPPLLLLALIPAGGGGFALLQRYLTGDWLFIPWPWRREPEIKIPDSIKPGTNEDKCRLRVHPLGRNQPKSQDVLFEKKVRVGRGPDNDIVVPDGQVSGTHCTLSLKDGRILVEDAGSRNGTRVNGVPINRFIHAEPDSILGVGRRELRMQLLPAGTR
jgi:Mg-chelatase subunit ChlD